MFYDTNQLLSDLITRDALLIWGSEIHRLEGPFGNREEAAAAADLLKARLSEGEEPRSPHQYGITA